MCVAIYSVVIVLFCVGMVLFFVLKNKRDKKILAKKKEEEKLDSSQIEDVTLEEEQNKIFDTTEKPLEKKEFEFEDFTLNDEQPAPKIVEEEKKRTFVNPFAFDDDDLDFEEDEDDDDFMDDKFAEYEDFLQNNLHEGNNNPWFKSQDENVLDELKNFDFDSLKGRSESEIKEIIKNLPPKAQEILLADVLAKKNFDEKED